MSTRRMQYELVGNAGNIEAVLNRLDASIARVGGQSRRVTNDMGLWQRQMAAMGTTARYSLAAGIVFGVTGAIASLSRFERKWGQVEALMSGLNTRAGFAQAGKDINQLADWALLASNRLATPVENIQNQLQTFYSSFGVPQGRQGTQNAEQFAEVVTKLGAVSETTDFTKLTEGVIGFSNAVGGGRKDVELYANEMARFVQLSVGFRGDVLAQYIGQLGSAANLGGFSGPQALGLVAAASQVGGSPAVIARGSAQLMRSILQPRTASQKAAYGSLGLPTDPVLLAQMGGQAVLQKMMAGVTARGGLAINRGRLKSMTEEDLAAATTPGDVGVAGGGAGVAFNLFGRVESLRTFAALLSANKTQRDLAFFVKQMADAGANMKDLNSMFKAFRSQADLSAGAIAISNAALSAVRNFDPVLHTGARAVTGVSNLIVGHPHEAAILEYALGAGLGLRTLGKIIPRVGRGLGRIPLLGKALGMSGGMAGQAAGAALAAESLQNVLTGGRTDGSRANPYWVIIHPDSWYVGVPGGSPFHQPSGVPGTGPSNVRNPSRLFNRLPIPLAVAAGVGLPFALGAGAYYESHVGKGDNPVIQAAGRLDKKHSLADFLAKADPGSSWGWRQDMARMVGGQHFAAQTVQVEGHAKTDLTIRLVDAQGNVLTIQEKKGVPTKLWQKHAAPQHRGKPGTSRKGQP